LLGLNKTEMGVQILNLSFARINKTEMGLQILDLNFAGIK
jgi:hypothetical protein